jgi:hypothetical protein
MHAFDYPLVIVVNGAYFLGIWLIHFVRSFSPGAGIRTDGLYSRFDQAK